jgi:transposase
MENGREQRGLVIAATTRLAKKGDTWTVPSQTVGGRKYTVAVAGETTTCSCPDYEAHQERCKHIYAVEFTIRRETNPDGTTTETRTLRVTYQQNWPAYNTAQTNEKARVEELLRALCEGIVQPEQKRGRPRLALSEAVFAATMKVYSTVSGRRASTDIRRCQENGHIAHAPHYNSVFNYLESPSLTPILKALVEESASPLKAVETDFAIDSSGFSTCTFARWFDKKYGKETRGDRVWIKAHVMTGVKTNVVTSIVITDSDVHDSPYFPPLVRRTAERFDIGEISADKAYLSNMNLGVTENVGAVPYIPFKSNSKSQGSEQWCRMWAFYQFKRPEFMAHYHKRSNIESTFSMLKRKFGASVRSKKPTAQVNEILCKVLCHNLAVLVHSIYELDIAPTFWAETTLAQEMSPKW